MRLASPKSSKVVFFKLKPASSVINCPFVRIQISSKIDLRVCPNHGARTAARLAIPRNLFKTNVAKTSLS
jgi:hypothetical protein